MTARLIALVSLCGAVVYAAEYVPSVAEAEMQQNQASLKS